MLRISSCLSKIITSKHWHIPNADTGFPELHVTSLQGSKTEYFNVNQLTNLLDINSWTIIVFVEFITHRVLWSLRDLLWL